MTDRSWIPWIPSPPPRRAALLSLFLFACFPAACRMGVDGNGQRSTEARALRDFSRVESDSSLDVQVEQGDAFAVTVSIDSNLQRLVLTRVSGDTLVVDVDDVGIGDTVSGPQVLVTMPRLEGALLRGSGNLAALSFDQQDAVALDLEGSGNVTFTGDVPGVTARLGGSGDMRIEGIAAAVDLRLDGSGRLDARSCTASSADVSLSGSGSVSATVTGAARVSLSGSGDIDLYGGGTLESSSVSGSGQVHQR